MRCTPKLSALAFSAVASAATFGAQAQSVDVRVIGTITPAACVPNIAGGAVIDYGNIPASSLNTTDYTALPEMTAPFTMTCDAPTLVALRAIDNRASSVIPGITAEAVGSGWGDTYNYGLGTYSGVNVGGYVVRLRQGSFSADGNDLFTVTSTNDGASWGGSGTGGVQKGSPHLVSWSATNGGAPIAFTTLSGNFTVEAALNRGEDLPLTDEIPLDGLVTLEVVYL